MAIYIQMHADATCFSCLLKNILKERICVTTLIFAGYRFSMAGGVSGSTVA